jgi:hypothetical protein
LASNSCPPLASSGAPWSRTQSMAKLSKLNHTSRGHRLQLRAQQLMHTVHFPRNGAPGPIFRGCTACRAFGAPPRRRRPRRLIYYRAERVELKVNSRRCIHLKFHLRSVRQLFSAYATPHIHCWRHSMSMGSPPACNDIGPC